MNHGGPAFHFAGPQTLRFLCPWLLLAATIFAAPPPPAPLADAIERQDRAAIRALLSDSRVNAAQADGMTALHWAVQHDDPALIRALLAAGANARAANRYGVTPLALACTNGHAEIVDQLLAAGADPNAPLRGGETPLMTAARTGRLGPVKLLIARGADVNAKLPEGQTALMWAAAEGHGAVVEALLSAGAEFQAPLETGLTPLLFAARAGHAEVVKTLLRAGVDVNAATQPTKPGKKAPPRGSTALSIAVENGHLELAAHLIEAGADPNDQRCGYTPLHILTWVRKADRGEDEGAPEPVITGRFTTPDFIRWLVAHGARVNERLKGGPAGGGRIARMGCTPFMLAADTADTAYLKLLLELGADPTITNVDDCTPLMAAAGLGTRSAGEEAGTEDEAIAAVNFLLGLGADINAVTKRGDSAMHGAAFANFPKVVKLLHDRGAKIEVWNRKNARGWTPLLIAEGHRFGNFKPSFETIAAIHDLLRIHGITPPPLTPRVDVKGYEAPN